MDYFSPYIESDIKDWIIMLSSNRLSFFLFWAHFITHCLSSSQIYIYIYRERVKMYYSLQLTSTYSMHIVVVCNSTIFNGIDISYITVISLLNSLLRYQILFMYSSSLYDSFVDDIRHAFWLSLKTCRDNMINHIISILNHFYKKSFQSYYSNWFLWVDLCSVLS